MSQRLIRLLICSFIFRNDIIPKKSNLIVKLAELTGCSYLMWRSWDAVLKSTQL